MPATKNDAPKYQRNFWETAETSFTVRGATGVTVQDHHILAPATKNDAPKYQRNFWETAETSFALRGATGATAQDHQTIATATKNDVPKYQRHFLGKRLKTYIARSNTGVIPQHCQILRLPRKITFQNSREIFLKRLKCHLQCVPDPTMIRTWFEQKIRQSATEVTFRAHHALFVSKNATFCAPDQSGSYQILHQPRKVTVEYTKFCTCHEN